MQYRRPFSFAAVTTLLMLTGCNGAGTPTTTPPGTVPDYGTSSSSAPAYPSATSQSGSMFNPVPTDSGGSVSFGTTGTGGVQELPSTGLGGGAR